MKFRVTVSGFFFDPTTCIEFHDPQYQAVRVKQVEEAVARAFPGATVIVELEPEARPGSVTQLRPREESGPGPAAA